jgi:hypothetical protein
MTLSARRKRIAAALLVLAGAGGAVAVSSRWRKDDPLTKIPVLELPRTDVHTFTKNVLLPRFEPEPGGIVATNDIRFALFARLTPEAKCRFLSNAHVACTDDAAKAYLDGWKPRLAGARIQTDGDRATFIASDGEKVVAKSPEENHLVIHALFDSGRGLRLADPSSHASIYLAPFNRSHLRAFTIDENGKADDQSYDSVCAALDHAHSAKLYRSIATTIVGGFDQASLSDLDVGAQVLLTDVVGIAYAECYGRLKLDAHDARGVQCGDIWASMMLRGYAIDGAQVVDPTDAKPVLRTHECRWPMAKREIATRLRTGELFTSFLAEHEKALHQEIASATGGKGEDDMSELFAALESGKMTGPRAAQLTGKLFDVLSTNGLAIDALLAAQFERGTIPPPSTRGHRPNAPASAEPDPSEP